MIIRKLFEFENAHIVRFCSSKRCKTSIHGHSYKVEVLLESKYLDNAGMVYDFGLLKDEIRQIIDSFDHAITLFKNDDSEYLKDMKRHSKRWIILPVNVSAENFVRVFFILIDTLLQKTKMFNGEQGVKLQSIIVHETRTGYAQGFKEDAYSEFLPKINLEDIEFSEAIQDDWKDKNFYINLKDENFVFINQKEV
ncbi:6-carboxytetrahydropterin synthase [Campylobacter insulaenigrae]|uniref:6-carboxy-5,6,7,8-tetrahydropterin synthase n=1 Tax=Campylobacter insulaenigrae TaxID=260714 RepID=A0ABY3G7T9_9BACT|nr:6-carboxytetrahydropterin synthase [Campylobacter insulaenigrae]MCR6570994.1 6-carboxytetrahydropterin synthase [Campylobacter insulaenigrae]MCR6572586.1 6-carboxytetrahydropterin synthase [Campylobacter insulaenigrae]MCR6573928.1 6-carboxytetrahydropterin synthase [Campylobacter insulaenigrae]MCR6575678.1 6-carboxytetrahydropterin synthase [Campylobacter insulaenigrae]MCR6576960.1 6-carboxytetrahydropterin synthase [Campylobacter insulaenigrae]